MAEIGSAILLSSMFRLFRLTRTLVLVVTVLVIAGAGACFARAGRMLVDPGALRPPQEADAIVVLSGRSTERWLEGYELWREKRAGVIVISPGYPDGGVVELTKRGVHVPTEADQARDILTQQLGVPAAAVVVMPGPLDNTAAEALAARALAEQRGWDSVIVVTSLAHTRRTALAMRRVLDPAGIAVQVRASRFDNYMPSGWWRSRSSARWVLSEWPKLLAYRLGLRE